jgi:hypothetical protein
VRGRNSLRVQSCPAGLFAAGHSQQRTMASQVPVRPFLPRVTAFFFFLLVGIQGMNACKAGTLPLEPHLQSFAVIILEMGVSQIFSWADLGPQFS